MKRNIPNTITRHHVTTPVFHLQSLKTANSTGLLALAYEYNETFSFLKKSSKGVERMMRAKSFQPYCKWREQQNKAVLERNSDLNL